MSNPTSFPKSIDKLWRKNILYDENTSNNEKPIRLKLLINLSRDNNVQLLLERKHPGIPKALNFEENFSLASTTSHLFY